MCRLCLGINTIVRTAGGAIGAQAAAAILAGSTTASGPPAELGYTRAFAVFATTALCALVVATAIPGRKPRLGG